MFVRRIKKGKAESLFESDGAVYTLSFVLDAPSDPKCLLCMCCVRFGMQNFLDFASVLAMLHSGRHLTAIFQDTTHSARCTNAMINRQRVYCHFFIIITTSRGAVDSLTRKLRKRES